MEHSKQPSKKLFIGVIDDSATVCHILETVLTQEGHQVKSFLDPVSAQRSILKTGETPPPDLVFIDLNLPLIPGYEVIRILRKEPASMHIPIIVISRDDSPTAHISVRLAGANAYLAKPSRSKIFSRVSSPLQRSPIPTHTKNKYSRQKQTPSRQR